MDRPGAAGARPSSRVAPRQASKQPTTSAAAANRPAPDAACGDGVRPRELHLDRLLARVSDGVVREVILATNFTNEGEVTAHYLGEMLKSRGLRVSRIARGVPVVGELEYVDAGTLAQALRERRPLAV